MHMLKKTLGTTPKAVRSIHSINSKTKTRSSAHTAE